MYIPNSFTPNLDGKNDVLKASTLNIVEGAFRVYDRWGGLVYECQNLGDCGWDGTNLEGKNALTGVYMVVFQGRGYQNEQIIVNQSVLLIR